MKEERIATPVTRSLVRNDTPSSLPRAAATPPLSGEARAAEGVGLEECNLASRPAFLAECLNKPWRISDEAMELLERADEALDDRPRSYGETILEREDLLARLLRAYAKGHDTFQAWAGVLFSFCMDDDSFDYWKAVRTILYIYGKRAIL
ncbi:MAG: hypothetical protein IJK63_09470 [Oscillospiraceae bacterium]|nr:hypothetical protein [Oscillospiraceae bacterium]